MKTTPSLISWLVWLAAAIWFVIGRWPDLGMPFFWDELGVYGPGVLHLLDHGWGLLPADMPPDLSRGHPLLFYSLNAAVAEFAGFSPFTMHFTGLVIALVASWQIKQLAGKAFGEWAGLIAGLSWLAMPAVFVQSGLLLPEMLLTCFVLAALGAWWQGHTKAYLIWASLAILTKESGLVLPAAVFAYVLFQPQKRSLKALGLALAPWLSFVMFLVIQRVQNGWFLFPYHQSLISFAWPEVSDKIIMSLSFLFIQQGRYVLAGIVWVAILWVVQRGPHSPQQQAARQLMILSGWLLLAMLGFSVLNAYMDRYLLFLLALEALAVGATFDALQRWRANSGWALYVAVLLFLAYHWVPGRFHYDVSMEYREVLKAQQQATDYLMEHIPAGDTVYANFPLYSGFTDPRLGFVSRKPDFYYTVRHTDPLNWIAEFEPGVPWVGPPLPDSSHWQLLLPPARVRVFQVK